MNPMNEETSRKPTTVTAESSESVDTAADTETPAPKVNDFEEFSISPEVLSSVKKMKYETATAVQKACIPYLLDNEHDIVALAKTGTGKTAAFGIPLVEKIDAAAGLQGLVLCPTRELAQQVSLNIKNFGLDKRINVATVLGGESYDRQIRALRSNPHVLVSTPGRLIDLMEQKLVNLKGVRFFILDEADEMLSFGFQDALETVWKSLEGEEFNTWLFSATMSDSIRRLAKKYLDNPHEVKLNTKAEKINIESFATVVFEEDKEDALSLLIKNETDFYGIIFATTKKQVADLEIKLRKLGLDVDSLHGDKVQSERTRTINRMKSRQTKILVATDVAARGLDIQDLTHVVNFEIPWDTETFTHRIGRTARAGKTGIVWTFVKPKESHQLRKFERALGFEFKNLTIPKVEDVQVFQKMKWMRDIAELPFRESDFVKFEKALQRLDNEKVQELSLETRQWLVRALQYFGQSEELRVKQPRSLELRKADDRSSRDYSSGGARGGYRGSDSRGERSYSSRGGGSRGGYRGGSDSRSEGSYSSRGPRREGSYSSRGPRSEGSYSDSKPTWANDGDSSARSERSSSARSERPAGARSERSPSARSERPSSSRSDSARSERPAGGRSWSKFGTKSSSGKRFSK